MTKYTIIGGVGFGLTAIIALFSVYNNPTQLIDGEECSGMYKQQCESLLTIKSERDRIDAEQTKANLPYLREKQRRKEEADAIRDQLIATARMQIQLGGEIYATELEENFIKWTHSLVGTPYELGGKSRDAIDCSGLFTLFGEELGIVSKEYMIHVGNSYNLFSRKSTPKDVGQRGDVLFFKSKGQQPNHIAVIERHLYSMLGDDVYDIIDASYGNGVSQRTITIRDGKYSVDGYHYDVTAGTNPLIVFNEEKLESMINPEPVAVKAKSGSPISKGDMVYFTRYDLGDKMQNDSSPCIGASGQDLCKMALNGIRTMALTKDMRIKYGVDFWDKVTLEGDAGCAGTYQVHDEMNCRFRGANAHDNGTCYTTKGEVASGYVKRPETEYYIKGDVAAYGDHQPSGGACRIAHVEKAT